MKLVAGFERANGRAMLYAAEIKIKVKRIKMEIPIQSV